MSYAQTIQDQRSLDASQHWIPALPSQFQTSTEGLMRFSLSGRCPATGQLGHHFLSDHQKEATQNRDVEKEQDRKNQPMPDVQAPHNRDLLPRLPIA